MLEGKIERTGRLFRNGLLDFVRNRMADIFLPVFDWSGHRATGARAHVSPAGPEAQHDRNCTKNFTDRPSNSLNSSTKYCFLYSHHELSIAHCWSQSFSSAAVPYSNCAAMATSVLRAPARVCLRASPNSIAASSFSKSQNGSRYVGAASYTYDIKAS